MANGSNWFSRTLPRAAVSVVGAAIVAAAMATVQPRGGFAQSYDQGGYNAQQRGRQALVPVQPYDDRAPSGQAQTRPVQTGPAQTGRDDYRSGDDYPRRQTQGRRQYEAPVRTAPRSRADERYLNPGRDYGAPAGQTARSPTGASERTRTRTGRGTGRGTGTGAARPWRDPDGPARQPAPRYDNQQYSGQPTDRRAYGRRARSYDDQVGRPYRGPVTGPARGPVNGQGPRGGPRYDGRPRQSVPPQAYDDGTYTVDEITGTGHAFFGSISKGLAEAIEYTFQRAGRPNGYILGQEAGGAFVAGLRYGEGTLHTKNAGRHPIYWQGPTIGYDFGGEGSRVMMLVYDLPSVGAAYQRFAGVGGSAYLVGGVGVTFHAKNRIKLAPIRSGVGLRLGANVGYLKMTRGPTWNPF